MKVRTIKMGYCPDQIELNGSTLKNYIEADTQAYPITNRPKHNVAADLKAQGLTVCLVEVMNPRLKGKTDLHNQPYKPSIFIFADLHTPELFTKWREDVNFWKKQFSPRTKKWMKETAARINKPRISELWDGTEAAKTQAIKELLN